MAAETMRPFHYLAPRRLDEALSSLTPRAIPLAGGTDLFLRMERRQTQPDTVVDLKRIPGMDGVEAVDGEFRIGALALMETLATSPLISDPYGALAQSARVVGSIQTRNRATVGGNLANASPAADTATPLMALGATVESADAGGTREMPVDELFLGPGRTALREGEILIAVRLPALPARSGSAFQRCVRTAMDIAVVNCAAFVRLDGDDPDTVGEARIALGAVGPTPMRAASAESHHAGAPQDQR
ncbi:MAG: FAD binding domain-containing protein, partial [Deltaproteobacteria bacterium]|nr:FAD binding domain-containing protein [Deltaproteobacteria bacterium]